MPKRAVLREHPGAAFTTVAWSIGHWIESINGSFEKELTKSLRWSSLQLGADADGRPYLYVNVTIEHDGGLPTHSYDVPVSLVEAAIRAGSDSDIVPEKVAELEAFADFVESEASRAVRALRGRASAYKRGGAV